MARPNKIWYRKDRKTYYVTIDGKLYNLGKDKQAAEKTFHKLMAEEQQAASVEGVSAAVLMDKFLLWCRDNRAPRTFEWYTDHLQRLLDSLSDQNIAAADFKPFHVYEAVRKRWSASYKRGFMVACQRAFRWAVKHGHIDRSPIEHLEKPTASRRDNCPTQAEFDAMLLHVNEQFKTLLHIAWETGARPQELFQLKGRHFKGDRLILNVEESKGKREKRVIYLTEKAAGLIAGLAKMKCDYLLVNTKGRPWNKQSVGCTMGRIQKKTGKRFCLYDIRHAFATRMLESGLDHLTVAKLMGHKNGSQLAKTYSHIGEKSDFLLKELQKASNSSK